jgi:hypothetical protein
VLPIVEARRHELVGNDFAIGDHARILPTPGHTPGHAAFTLGRGRDDAVFSGDLIHSPLQARYPEMSMKFDVDQAAAAKTRRSFLERYCDRGTLCCTAHFPSPSVREYPALGDGFSAGGLNAGPQGGQAQRAHHPCRMQWARARFAHPISRRERCASIEQVRRVVHRRAFDRQHLQFRHHAAIGEKPPGVAGRRSTR